MSEKKDTDIEVVEATPVNKDDFLSKLMEASKPSDNKPSFSTSGIRRRNKNKSNRISSEDDSSLMNLSEGSLSFGRIKDDETWDKLMDRFNDIDPIDDITSEDKLRYRKRVRGKEQDEYDVMFDKEHSMYNEVLEGLNQRSKIINERIKSMTGGKRTFGVSKGLNDLIENANSIDTTKMNVIKNIADLKKTAFDMRMKQYKITPPEVEETVDSIADKFYKQIVSGSSNDFIQSSMNQYSLPGDSSNGGMFNLSQGIPVEESGEGYNYETDDDIDAYGYIRNEDKNINVCVYRYPDGTFTFVALDEEGNNVDDYELPDPDLASQLTTKPTSNYAYDIYNRKYRIVDIEDVTYASLDDIDDIPE